MTDAKSGQAGLYREYAAWKDWHGDFVASDRESRYFAAELKGVPLASRRVLEIGFGNGSFLAWAKAQGASVTGTEIDQGLLAHAREKGFDVRPAALDELSRSGAQFDLVAAFDVLEHWDKQSLITNLQYIAAMLAPAGLLLARFPNGQSPFGRVHQYGDITHQIVLSSSSIAQLAQIAGFEVVRVDNACSVPVRTDWWSVHKHGWRKRRRARIEVMLGKLYGVGRLPLDPNLTAVLRKKA
jgi:2-polyprenyl-3-methyl-5-hydroxy-6-metoxy-1,4-benzoquinol methylase